MKNLIIISLLVALTCARGGDYSVKDLIKKYLETYSALGGDSNVYADDRLLRIDSDVFGDGHTEVLLSMSRDRNGKEGNCWTVYRDSANGYINVGGMTFNSNDFYIGTIDGIGKNGLVAFWPSGNGEGILHAYVLEGGHIQESTLGDVTRDATTRELAGMDKAKRYFGKEFGTGRLRTGAKIQMLNANELAREYGLRVQSRTYQK